MFRALLVLAALAPTSALACGMYIPPESSSVKLTDLLDEVDEVEEEAPSDEEIAAARQALQQETTANGGHAFPSERVRPASLRLPPPSVAPAAKAPVAPTTGPTAQDLAPVTHVDRKAARKARRSR